MSTNSVDWEAIYEAEAPRLLGMCRRYVGELSLAEDLLQDGFLTAMAKADQYQGRGAFEGWLRQVVLTTVLQHLRKAKNIHESSEEVLSIAEAEPEPAATWEAIAEHLTMAELMTLVDQLPTHHRAVFNLYVVEGYTHKEIGTMLKISPGTSKSHLKRARRKLQTWMFDEAARKGEEKKRRRWAFLWFIFPGHAFDRWAKGRLQDYSISPSRGLPTLGVTPPAISQAIVPRPRRTSRSYWVAASVGVLGVLALVLNLMVMQESEPQATPSQHSTIPHSLPTVDSSMIILLTDPDPLAIPSLQAQDRGEEASSHEATTPAPVPPVVVRRQVVVKRMLVPDTTGLATQDSIIQE